MKLKTALEAMKINIAKTLDGAPLELLGISDGETKDEESGIVIPYQRYEVEVPRGYDEYSRCRFSVKVPNGKVKVTEKDLEDAYYVVTFSGLEVSFVSEKGLVYFKATEAAVKKED